MGGTRHLVDVYLTAAGPGGAARRGGAKGRPSDGPPQVFYLLLASPCFQHRTRATIYTHASEAEELQFYSVLGQAREAAWWLAGLLRLACPLPTWNLSRCLGRWARARGACAGCDGAARLMGRPQQATAPRRCRQEPPDLALARLPPSRPPQAVAHVVCTLGVRQLQMHDYHRCFD